MAIPKMGLFQNLKDLVTKGPSGMVNERMKESLEDGNELMNLDRSDPEAMRAYMARKNASIDGVLGSLFGKNPISEKNRAGIEQLQNQAIENQAAIYQMLQERKAAKDAGGAEPTSGPANPEINKK